LDRHQPSSKLKTRIENELRDGKTLTENKRSSYEMGMGGSYGIPLVGQGVGLREVKSTRHRCELSKLQQIQTTNQNTRSRIFSKSILFVARNSDSINRWEPTFEKKLVQV
jgi:hypothetical protein